MFQGYDVSIQLMSPASGDPLVVQEAWLKARGFHSINVPSEWGHEDEMILTAEQSKFPFN